MEILGRPAHQSLFDDLGFKLPSETTVDETRETLRTQAKASLYFFITAILNWQKVQKTPHFDLCQFIQQVPPTFPDRKRRKLLLIPRDTYKTTVGSKSFPLWVLIQDEFCGLPGKEHRILLWSHSSDNSKKHIKSIRQQVERNQVLAWVFPELIPDLARTTWTDSNLLFPREGTYGEDTIEAAGIDTHLVSRHYTLQIKDDLEDRASAEQPSVRAKVKEAYKSAEALFVDERAAYDLLIGTRWGHDDLYADIIEHEHAYYERMVRPLHWTHTELKEDLREAESTGKPATWAMDPTVYAPDQNKTYYFFPELFPEESCQRIRAKQGSFMYSMLYLNNPRDPSLAEFKEGDLRYFVLDQEQNLILTHDDGSTEIVPFDSCRRVLFWDPAMSEQEQKRNSRNAMVVMFEDPKGRLFIVDLYADWKNPTFLFHRFIGFHVRYAITTAAIEDVGFQRTLKFPLFFEMRKVNHVFHVEEQAPIGSKDARIRSLIPFCENHMLWVRRGLTLFVEELKAFPVFKTKDIIDAAAACVPLFGLSAVQSPQVQRRRASNENLRLATRNATTGY